MNKLVPMYRKDGQLAHVPIEYVEEQLDKGWTLDANHPYVIEAKEKE